MSDESARPASDLIARVELLLGARVLSWTRVHGGYTPAARWIARWEGASAFVKIATTELTAKMMRREGASYALGPFPFMPRLIGYDEHAEAPLLIIEDLSRADWPPPWTRTRFEAVRAAIAAMHVCGAPAPRKVGGLAAAIRGWALVAEDPAPFLSLGVADESWLKVNLPPLLAAEQACDQDGEAFTHFDLRSDNMCVTPQGAKLVDWAEACRSNPKLDLGSWAPSLEYEGGPKPEELLGHEPEVAAVISGYFAARAAQPKIPDAPRVRDVQRAQLSTAFPWVIRALRLAAP